MALFAGGRYIRSSLERISDEFWPTTSTPFTFFRFDTPRDGEDLKHEFKKRLAESDGVFSSDQRRDILHEAASIFDNMLLLVAQLDDVCYTPPSPDEPSPDSQEAFLNWPLRRRIRDSVAVAKARGRVKPALHSPLAEESDSDDGEEEGTPAAALRKMSEEGTCAAKSDSSSGSEKEAREEAVDEDLFRHVRFGGPSGSGDGAGDEKGVVGLRRGGSPLLSVFVTMGMALLVWGVFYGPFSGFGGCLF